MATTTILPAPTSPPVDPIPTVIPTPVELQAATENGYRALWAVFGLMVLASAAFAGLSWRVPVPKRLYHVVTTIITLVAALSYYAMATGHGQTQHCVRVWDHHDKVPDTARDLCRQVFFARYVDWAITTPLLLLDLALLAGIDGAHTLMAVVADIVMILAGLFAALGGPEPATPASKGHDAYVVAGQKWGWYAIAVLAYLVVIWHVAIHGTRAARAKGGAVARVFGGLAPFTFVLWTAYPIVWALADGARKVDVNGEIYAYAVLDVLAKAGFGAWLLLAHRRAPETHVDIGGYWAHGLETGGGRIRLLADDEA